MNKVKVVILNWNGERHLERFLPSVVANTPKETEIIVADNGSTDKSTELIKTKFPSVKLICLPENYGYAEGYNKALASEELRDAEYFVLLNSDVETPVGWLKPLYKRLETDQDVAAVAPKILSVQKTHSFEYAGAAGGFIDWFGYPFCRGRILSTVENDKGQYNDAREVFWASGACLMVRADVFRQTEGFDGDFFAHMEEIDLCWRLNSRGWKVMVEPRSVVLHLGGGTLPNESPGKLYLNYRNNLYMLYKNLSPSTLVPVIFMRMLLDGIAAGIYLLLGKREAYEAVRNAHRDYWKEKNNLKRKRKKNIALRKMPPKGIYKGSIVLRYFFGRKTFGDLM